MAVNLQQKNEKEKEKEQEEKKEITSNASIIKSTSSRANTSWLQSIGSRYSKVLKRLNPQILSRSFLANLSLSLSLFFTLERTLNYTLRAQLLDTQEPFQSRKVVDALSILSFLNFLFAFLSHKEIEDDDSWPRLKTRNVESFPIDSSIDCQNPDVHFLSRRRHPAHVLVGFPFFSKRPAIGYFLPFFPLLLRIVVDAITYGKGFQKRLDNSMTAKSGRVNSQTARILLVERVLEHPRWATTIEWINFDSDRL